MVYINKQLCITRYTQKNAANLIQANVVFKAGVIQLANILFSVVYDVYFLCRMVSGNRQSGGKSDTRHHSGRNRGERS